MMESQGPTLSKGLPEQETGASDDLSQNTNDVNYRFQNSKGILEDGKNCQPLSRNDMEASSPTTLSSHTIPTTRASVTSNKYQEKQFLASVSTDCCESTGQAADQDCFMVDGNIDEQLSSHFQHSSAVNHDEEMEMTFSRSVYGEIGDKDIGSFHSSEGEDSGRGQLHARIKPAEFNLISVDGRVVPLGLEPLVSPNESDLVQCSSTALQSDQQQRNAEETSLMENSSIDKEPREATTNKEQHVTSDEQGSASHLASAALLQEQGKNMREITIQVYPGHNQAISLVTNNILANDVTSFSTQVPAILTEGDVEDSEQQYQVVTTSSVLSQGDGCAPLDVLTTSSDLCRNVILTEQQQVLLSGMLVPGVTGNQAIHINMTQDAGMDMDDMPQDDQEEEECTDGKGHACPHPDCNKVCSKASKLKLHMLTHTGERPHKCPHEGCEWAFTTAYKLKRHARGHTGEKPFLCSHEGCGKSFTTAYNLKTHLRSHFRTDTFVCGYEGCDKTFPTAHKLKVHERRHQANRKPYTCEMEGCGKVFSSVGTLTSHLKTHSGEKPHACPLEGCEKRFTKASKLKLHLRSHTGERPFHCDIEGCGWSFTSAYKLKRHMRKHTGERPFLCNYEGCGKSFTRSSHLKTHKLVHTGEKPYVCPIEGCGKAFTAGGSLNIHMCKHTGQKPYKCEIDGCNKTYTTAANLRAHQKRHVNKGLTVDFHDSSHGDLADLSVVSCGSNASETEPEVMYTTIGAFHPSNFNLDDAARLSSVGTLCTLVTSTGHPLISPSTEIVLETDKKQSDDVEIKTSVSGIQVPVSIQQEQFVTEGLENNAKLDVSEFVVRSTSDDQDPISHHSVQSRAEVVGGTVLEGGKLSGGFDLCITSMMSHITSETGQDESGSATKTLHPSEKRSRTLDFRDVHPEDQFAPPAVIFQDEIKSSDTENEAEVLVAQIQQSPEGIPVVQLPRESTQISLPQGLLTEPAVAMAHVPDVEHMEVDTNDTPAHAVTSEIPLVPIPSLPDVTEERESLEKGDLSPYMDTQSSSEQDEGNGDTYPESTINLQDLR